MSSSFFSILEAVNQSSTDDGSNFIDSRRKDAIRTLLANGCYVPIKEDGISLIYRHAESQSGPSILISSHIDSLYGYHHHSHWNEFELLGTFDNSISNAMLIDLMKSDKLPPNVFVAFTGDEEDSSRGADETINHFRHQLPSVYENIELVVVMDVTAEGYGKFDYTIENFFNENSPLSHSKLRFSSKSAFKLYLQQKIPNHSNKTLFIPDQNAGPDESWQYDEHDLNCFSLCLPTKPHSDNEDQDIGSWMHDDKGILVKTSSIIGYQTALTGLISSINLDL